MVDVHPGVDLDRIRNRATVTRTGGTAQTFTDGPSTAAYGTADYGNVTTPYLVDDNQALSLASYIVSVLKDPRAPARGMTVYNESDALMTQMLTRELGDRVTITEPKAKTSGDFYIERIQHQVTDGGNVHATTWGLSERTSSGNPFVLGTSTLGGGDVLTY
jgi:hypothetical protein